MKEGLSHRALFMWVLVGMVALLLVFGFVFVLITHGVELSLALGAAGGASFIAVEVIRRLYGVVVPNAAIEAGPSYPDTPGSSV